MTPSTTNVAPASNHHFIIDQRGYVFRFPSLGLPDPNGEWIIIRAAIGPRDKAFAKVKNDGIEPPMRYPHQNCGMMDIVYENAIWVTPLVAPHQVSGNGTEVFLLKTRRLPLSPGRYGAPTRLDDGQEMCHVVHPRGMAEFEASSRATLSDDQAFWRKTLASLASSTGKEDQSEEEQNEEEGGEGGRKLNADFINGLRVESFAYNHPAIAPRLAPAIEAGRGLEGLDYLRATLPSIERLKKEREKELMDWEESPQSAFNQDWYRKTRKDFIVEAKITKTAIDANGPGFSFRSLPSGEGARFDYTWLPTTDEDVIPRPEQWKRVPARAWKPGREFRFTNQARRFWGKEPLTESQWAVLQAEREEDEAAPGSAPVRRGGRTRKQRVEA